MATHSDACQVRTSAADGSGSDMVYLGTLGHVQGLSFGTVLPGGDNHMNCFLQLEPDNRPSALNPGRRTEVLRGAGVIWNGFMMEPTVTADGWGIAATGVGVKGADFQAFYTDPQRVDPTGTGTLINNTAMTDTHAVSDDQGRMISGKGIADGAVINTVSPGSSYSVSKAALLTGTNNPFRIGGWSLNDPVDEAIARGLPWVNGGIPDGWWINSPDNAATKITDHMNTITGKSGLTWYVDRWGNLITSPLPSDVTHLLVVTEPVARTLYGDINVLFIKYVSADDGQGSVTFSLTKYVNQDSVDAHGVFESYIDITNAGLMSSAAAVATGQDALSKYVRAAWAGPFTVRPGQLLNTGGVPVDLAMQRVGNMVCKLLLADSPFGGEVTAGPISFPAGEYVYDDDAQLATITPVQSFRTDLGAILSNSYKWATA